MELTIQISDLAEQMLGENPAAAVQALVEKEATRLWHIQRSQPKRREVHPVGRPPLTPEQRRFRQLRDWLLEVFTKRKEQLGSAFEENVGALYTEFATAVAAEDLPTLERIAEEKKWMRRWK